jgi:holliday junction DNA helicase RuvA
MIGSLRGTVQGIEEEEILLDVQGVGYVVSVTAAVLGKLQPSQELFLFTSLDVRENALQLFGFIDRLEREVFFLLKKVSGIGSKTALSILSTLGASEVLQRIAAEDLAAFQKVSGVGKKTAERIIVELREQVRNMVGEHSRGSTLVTPNSSSSYVGIQSVEMDAVLALEKLGFSSDIARRAVKTAVENNGKLKDSGELLQEALRFV